MVLYYKGAGLHFDWHGITPRNIFPELLYHDFDGDGAKELAVTLYYASGTGVSLMSLHILRFDENENHRLSPTVTEYVLSFDNIDDWLTEPILSTLSADGESFVMEFNGESHMIELLTEYQVHDGTTIDYTFAGVEPGLIVKFEIEDSQIKATVALGVMYEESAMPHYFGKITADVVFDGDRLQLEGYNFALY
jgi:hypothetical protein